MAILKMQICKFPIGNKQVIFFKSKNLSSLSRIPNPVGIARPAHLRRQRPLLCLPQPQTIIKRAKMTAPLMARAPTINTPPVRTNQKLIKTDARLSRSIPMAWSNPKINWPIWPRSLGLRSLTRTFQRRITSQNSFLWCPCPRILPR